MRMRRSQRQLHRSTIRATAQRTSTPQLTEKETAAEQRFIQQTSGGNAQSVQQQAVQLLTEAARNCNVSVICIRGQ